jgi:lipopolysaccharide biosynthesis protein
MLEEVQRAKNSSLIESGDYTSEVLREIDLIPNHLVDQPTLSTTEIGRPKTSILILIRKALSIARADPSLVSLIKSVLIYVRRKMGRKPKPITKPLISDIADGLPSISRVRILATFHVHYVEALDLVFETIEKFPPDTSFVVTTSQDLVYELANSRKTMSSIRVIKVPNRGRNFSPLVVELAEAVRESDVLFHFHSKRSTHSHRGTAEKWNSSLWSSIAPSSQTINDIVRILGSESGFGVAYLNPETFISKSSMSWHASRSLGVSWLRSKGIDSLMESFSYPAGGMFAARTESVRQIFAHDWSFEDFPLEMGQVDGQTHHMIERLFGYIPSINGFKHLLVSPEQGEVAVLDSPEIII